MEAGGVWAWSWGKVLEIRGGDYKAGVPNLRYGVELDTLE